MKAALSFLFFGLAFGSSFSWANVISDSGLIDNQLINIVDTRCTLSVANQVIDYGVQTRWQLKNSSNGSGQLTPGKRTFMFNAICPYAQSLKFSLRGSATSNGDLRYGDHGMLHFVLREAKVDNNNVQIARTGENGILKDTPQSTLLLKANESFSAMVNGDVAKGRYFSALIDIEPEITEADSKLRYPQVSESSFVLELVN